MHEGWLFGGAWVSRAAFYAKAQERTHTGNGFNGEEAHTGLLLFLPDADDAIVPRDRRLVSSCSVAYAVLREGR